MIDLLSLIKNTAAFSAVKGDLSSGRLSHAYLILTADGDNLDEYLKNFAKLIVCEEGSPCGKCRKCKTIDQNVFPDVVFYPKDGGAVTTEEVNSLIEESYIKPLESDKKVFIISQAQNMNIQAQNKLLKTLEEPPKGVHIIVGATSEFPLLSTVKSRLKKLEIPAFSKEVLLSALQEDCPDRQRLSSAIAASDGTVGKTKRLYGDDSLKEIIEVALDTLINMKSSSQVLEYSNKILSLRQDPADFLSVMVLLLRDLLVLLDGREDLVTNVGVINELKTAENFSRGAILHALEAVTQAEKRKKFNANPTMLVEWLLFQILEGKYKWQKL
jgi:DNA polymerase-3 subunit delta'